jgi:hypothetical protein
MSRWRHLHLLQTYAVVEYLVQKYKELENPLLRLEQLLLLSVFQAGMGIVCQRIFVTTYNMSMVRVNALCCLLLCLQ